MAVIDAHVHLWQVGRNGFEWPTPDLTAIYRDFGVDDLRAATGDELSGVVIVQSQPSEADTQWLLDVAADEPLILGVVGWTDLSTPDAAERVHALARHPKLKGLRPMLQGLPDDEWILRSDVAPALAAMQAEGLVFDALVFTRHLNVIATLARRYSALSIVIDHGAKPPIAMNRDRPKETLLWFEGITAVSRHTNVACKLSGLLTEMTADQPQDDAAPYIAHLIDSFGPDRLIFGSDWPVIRLRSDWRDWLEYLHTCLNHLTAGERHAILAGNAIKTYGLQGVP